MREIHLMNVLLVGETTPGQLAWLCARGFKQLGVAATLFDAYPFEKQRQSRFPPFAIAADKLQRAWANSGLLVTASRLKPDLILISKGEEITPATLTRLKQKAKIVNWNPDNPLNVLNSTPDLIKAIPFYDHCYIWGKFLLPELERLGAQRVSYLPFAYDPDLHQPRSLTNEERKRLASDLIFAGTHEPQRVEALNHLTDFDLAIWGNHWNRLPHDHPLRKHWRGDAHGDDLSHVYSASRVALNFIREQNGSAHNMRTFEAPACGIMLLTTRTQEQVELFGEDDGAVFFSSHDELRDKARYYLAHEEQRQQIAKRGQEKILQGHTYAERMKQILKDLEHGAS
ncbi:MAG: glycosyltransferase [Chloroflexota bacterium]